MRKKQNKQDVYDFEQTIDYSFINKELLLQSLTHSSYANENKRFQLQSNERLEFLGDAILDLIISEHIYEKYPQMPEGELTKLRASVVCEPMLAEGARKIHIGEFLYLGKGEDVTGGRTRDSILADAFEAVVGAVYLDGGMERARDHVLRIMIPMIEKIQTNSIYKDYKTQLQEIVQKNSKTPIEYSIVNEEGPDHNKEFFAEVIHDGKVLGRGKGRSKKEAEQNAALLGMRFLGEE